MQLSRLLPATALSLLIGVGCGHKPDTYDDDDGPELTESFWKGAVTLPGDMRLELMVHLIPGDDGAMSGTITIPAQGVEDAPLADVTDDGAAIGFTLAVPLAPAVFSAERDASGARADGVLQQGGQTLPLHLEATTPEAIAEAGLKRPQTPRPPFPYASRDASWDNAADGVTLAGTLTYPEGGGRHPAVLLITGSGQQDRDETIFEHKPFLVLADALTRRGFAVLRVDDRGVGGSSKGEQPVTIQSNLRDALASSAWLAAQPEVDPARVGLIGHSEGGILVALAAAAEPERFAFAVSLAGTGVRGDALLAMQVAAINRANGVPDERSESDVATLKGLTSLVIEGADEAALRAALEAATRESLERGDEDVKAVVEKTGFDALVAEQLARFTDPWLTSFIRLDPTNAWRKVRCPVLALNGEKDRQVPPEENLGGIREALTAGGNADITLETLPGLNHLFQTAETGAPGEYVQIEETMAPAALTRIGDWLTAKASLAEPGDAPGE